MAGSSEDLADALGTLEEGLEELKSGAEDIEGATEELSGLLERVKKARQDPGSLDGESYGELLTDITKFGADRLPLTDAMSAAIGVAAHALGSLVGLETDFALKIIAKRFVDLGGNSAMSEEEAEALSRKVSWDSTAQAAVFLWWRRGMPPIAEYSFGARLVKPLETFWIWVRLNVFGGTGVSTSSRLGCAAVVLFFLLLIAIVAWLVFSGGDEVPATSTTTTTTTTTASTTTTTATTTTVPTTTTQPDTETGQDPGPSPLDSVPGSASGQVDFETHPLSPPVSPYTAGFDIEVDAEAGRIKKTQQPSNQMTEGPIESASLIYFTTGGIGYFEAYVGVICLLPDGSYFIAGYTFGGDESMAETFQSLMDSIPGLDVSFSPPQSISVDPALAPNCDEFASNPWELADWMRSNLGPSGPISGADWDLVFSGGFQS